ncbi:MAG: SH3 domain-containing protein [Chloroflexota bacterium]
MKARHWSLAIVLVLVNYLIFATLFTRLLETDFSLDYATRTPVPTFTPAPAQAFIHIPTHTPAPVIPTATATRVLDTDSDNNTNNSAPANNQPATTEDTTLTNLQPQLIAPGSVNIRSGPGTNYDVIGTLNANTTRPIVGRNRDASWWQIQISENTLGWVSNSVVEPTNVDNVPLVEAPEASAIIPASVEAQPAANSQPAPTQEPYQYSPTGWYDDTNFGLTRFWGDIMDVNGNPVNGAFVMASCGDFSAISFPSGPVGWGTLNESADWRPGFYDLTVDTRPIPCIWTLTVVNTDDRNHVKGILSESIPIEITANKSIVVANWRKNW